MKLLFFRLLGFLFRRTGGRSLVPGEIHNILVVKLCCIGDVLFTTPLLRALRLRVPDAKITYMLSAWCRELVDQNPKVDAVIEFNPYVKLPLFSRITYLWKTVQTMRKGRFDLALVLHRTPLAGLMAMAGKIKNRVGFDWEGQGFSLTHSVPFRESSHEVDRYLDCLGPLDAAPAGVELELAVSASAETWAGQFLAAAGIDPQRPLVALFPAGGINPGTVMMTKRWPLDKFQALAVRLVKQYGAQLILVGSSGDSEIGDRLLAGQAWQAIRAEGKTSLAQLGALLKRCDLFIGGDSGPLYLANAVGTATVGIFGPSDPGRVAPRGTRHRTLYKKQDCSPCYTPEAVVKNKAQATGCVQPAVACMEAVSVDEVMRAAEELLQMR